MYLCIYYLQDTIKCSRKRRRPFECGWGYTKKKYSKQPIIAPYGT